MPIIIITIIITIIIIIITIVRAIIIVIIIIITIVNAWIGAKTTVYNISASRSATLDIEPRY
jgi:hypothetical protein